MSVVAVTSQVTVPLAVVLSAVVGLIAVLQQTPLAVTGAPPFEVTLPPLSAVVVVILEMAVVVTVGATVEVVKVRSLP